MKRRQFLGVVGGAAAFWPLSAMAQTPIPKIGFLNSASSGPTAPLLAAFRRGLGEGGYVEDRDVVIEYRWAEGQYERLPAMASDLVKQRVALIAATGGIVSARAAMDATSTIPILFVSGFDPVKLGLVKSLSRPTGNVTGVSVFTTELVSKRIQLLRDILPSVKSCALLVNPNSVVAEIEIKELEAIPASLGLQVQILKATNEREISDAFSGIDQGRIESLLVSADPFFTSLRRQITDLANRHRLPAAYPWREYAEVGGLMSYGPSITEAFRQIGTYAGLIYGEVGRKICRFSSQQSLNLLSTSGPRRRLGSVFRQVFSPSLTR